MSTAPWWGSGLFTVGGALLGTLATLTLGILNRKTERRRLTRDTKASAYPELVLTTNKMANLAVLPANDHPGDVASDVERLVEVIAFYAPAGVSTTLGPVVTATRDLAAVVARIRVESGPGHGGSIDRRLEPEHRDAVTRLRQATAAFATAARADLEIGTPYTPITTESEKTTTISPGAGSREPGAGSREPGAGSRELDRTPRLCHVG